MGQNMGPNASTGTGPSADTTQNAYTAHNEPVYVQAHIIDERDTPFGRKTTWTNTGNNPSAGFRTSWTSSSETDAHVPHNSSKGGFVTGVVQTVAGVGLMAAGVPMLIFPGPGIAAIAGGAALAGSGIRKIVGKR
ncbi:MAG: hypothetical protein IJC51_03430 [Eggerthellaceae bacterium]|nr:hypothetical protein [Eggerthellaceae bacterium]